MQNAEFIKFSHKKTAFLRAVRVLLKVIVFAFAVGVRPIFFEYFIWNAFWICFTFVLKGKVKNEMFAHNTFVFGQHLYHPFITMLIIASFSFFCFGESFFAESRSATYSCISFAAFFEIGGTFCLRISINILDFGTSIISCVKR